MYRTQNDYIFSSPQTTSWATLVYYKTSDFHGNEKLSHGLLGYDTI